MKLIAVLLVLMLSGCSTFVSKDPTRPDESQIGHAYSGTTQSLNYWRCFFEEAPASTVFTAVVVPYLVIDTSLSLLMDTAVLPGDLLAEAKNDRKGLDAVDCDRFWIGSEQPVAASEASEAESLDEIARSILAADELE